MRQFVDAVSRGQPEGGGITVVTYNILANKFATTGKHDYAGKHLLPWDVRGPKLMSEILSYAADILCLQEVERDMYERDWEPQLKSNGYESIYFGRETADPVASPEEGCVLLFSSERFQCQKSLAASFAQEIPRAAPDNDFFRKARQLGEGVAMAALKCRSCGSKILVASTHIHWDPEWPDIKAYQASLLCKMIMDFRADFDQIPVIIGGDFNSLHKKFYSDAYDRLDVRTRQQHVVSGTYELLDSGVLSVKHPHHPQKMRTRTDNMAGCPELSTHGLELKSVYMLHPREDGTCKEPPITTKTDRFAGCLDYIFVNRFCRVSALLDMPYLDLPEPLDPAGTNLEFGMLPDETFGSDHLAIGCRLDICGKPGAM